MTNDIYRELQRRLDKYSLGFPETETGVEIKILKKLFSQDDADLFLALSPILEKPEAIAKRRNQPVEAIAKQLEDMAARGLLFRRKKDDVVKYGAIPFVHGVFEFQVSRMDKDLAEMVDQYYHDGFNQAIIKGNDYFLRTVPINQSIDVKQNVAVYEDACEILRNMNLIVVTDCICRKQKDMLGGSCGKPLEVCFMFGSMAQYYLDHDMGRQVNADEAIRILESAQEAGLVTQPATAQNPSGMCSCCGDCCGILGSINLHPRPAEIVFSNYYAALDQELCTGCETCVDRCQMNALRMNDDELAEINPDRCIGCGLCVITCPADALTLTPKSDDLRRVPPVSGFDQMAAMAQKRGIQF